MADNKVVMVAKNTAANGAVLILLAVYLGAVVWKGNVGAFTAQLWQDFSGRPQGGPAFWQWGLAVIVLYAIAQNDSTEHIFGPLLAILIVAMLIQLAMKQPQLFANLTSGINKLFGGR
jgi:hypothetical protein